MQCDSSVFFLFVFVFQSRTPLLAAVEGFGSVSTVKLLLNSGADLRKTDRVSMIIIKLEFQSLMYVSSL